MVWEIVYFLLYYLPLGTAYIKIEYSLSPVCGVMYTTPQYGSGPPVRSETSWAARPTGVEGSRNADFTTVQKSIGSFEISPMFCDIFLDHNNLRY